MASVRRRLSWEQFCGIVKRVLDTLPKSIAVQLENVIVDVEEEPSAEVLRSVGLSEEEIAAGETIYGLFEPMFSATWSEPLDFHTAPHRIVIYKRPLEEDFPDLKQLQLEIRKTVIHELAHHFGWTDRDLERFDNTPDPFRDHFFDESSAPSLPQLPNAEQDDEGVSEPSRE